MRERLLDALGRRRPDGQTGIRHHLLVIPSVICAAQAAHVIAERTPGAVSIEHQHGCSQLGGDSRLTGAVLSGLGTHANVAGTLVVSLGCETNQGSVLHRTIAGRGQRAEFVGIQQSGGTLAAIEAGLRSLERLRAAAAADAEVAVGWRDLRVGVEGGWLTLPRPQAEVFEGALRDLVAAGATVIQAVPSKDLAGAPQIPVAVRGLRPAGHIPYAAPMNAATPGGPPGRAPAAAPARAASPGASIVSGALILMPAPATRIAQKTGLAATGAHVIISPLAEGLPAGCPVAPVVHVGIAPAARPFAGDVDVLLDEAPAAGAPAAILAAVAAACRSETAAETLGTFEMAIHRIAPTM